MFFWFYALFTFHTFNVDIKEIELYNNFVKELVNSNGTTLEIEIIINQFENSTSSLAEVSIQNEKKFSLSSSEEFIFFIDDTIKTWDKNQRKLIIEDRIEGDLTFFDIFFGKKKNLKFTSSKSFNEKKELSFTIPSLDYSGTIVFDSIDNKVSSLNIIYDTNNYIKINVISFRKKIFKMPEDLNKLDYEVIDLRE